MKTLIKLLIAAVILNAAARSGSATWTYFQFRDATQELVTFSGTTTMADLHNQIVSKAADLKVPLEDNNLVIEREGVRTVAKVSYSQPVEVFPNYVYPVSFSFQVDAFLAVGTLPPEPQR